VTRIAKEEAGGEKHSDAEPGHELCPVELATRRRDRDRQALRAGLRARLARRREATQPVVAVHGLATQDLRLGRRVDGEPTEPEVAVERRSTQDLRLGRRIDFDRGALVG
jgi:hypothetical protein